uniref:WRKY transcription factor 7 n=1 Tax=Santalum album TaxID=35974 RepID=A0A650C2T9_SANAL|nr:WRKY transcription factor 7 [Santalum album]
MFPFHSQGITAYKPFFYYFTNHLCLSLLVGLINFRTDKPMECEKRTLINELTQGLELAKQLGSHLQPSSSIETRESLVKRILSSYDKALKLLKCNELDCSNGHGTADSPPSLAGSSPRSDGSDRDVKDQYQKEVFKKRKTQPQWTEHVQICGGGGFEGPLDDGFSWRKYGQKEILGANFPRGYYRCSHRHVQGCLATKQVQRSDEDPSILEITYRGRHTCAQTSYLTAPTTTVAPPEKEPKKETVDQQQKQQPEEIMLNFKLKTEEFETKDQIFPSYSFSGEDYALPQSVAGNAMIGGFSPAFVSSANSESDYFMNRVPLRGVESDLAEIISDPASVTDSPIRGLDFSLDPVDLDPNFSLDALEFFS